MGEKLGESLLATPIRRGVSEGNPDHPTGAVHVIRTGLLVLAYLGLNSTLNLLNRYTLGHAGFRFPARLLAIVTRTCE